LSPQEEFGDKQCQTKKIRLQQENKKPKAQNMTGSEAFDGISLESKGSDGAAAAAAAAAAEEDTECFYSAFGITLMLRMGNSGCSVWSHEYWWLTIHSFCAKQTEYLIKV
jgi:hypothetical protein